MNVRITSRNIIRSLLLVTFSLLFLNISGIIYKLNSGFENVPDIVTMFDFNMKQNIPTLYSTFTLLICSALLLIIGIKNLRLGSNSSPWIVMVLIFLFLSIDELLSIHKYLTYPVRQLLNTSGLLYYAWVIPYSIALLTLGVFYLPFFVKLKKRNLFLFILSGVIYVSGAIGLEMLGGRHAEMYGSTNAVYSLLNTSEEFCEMIGVIIFIYSLLDYLKSNFNIYSIKIYTKLKLVLST